MQQTLILLSHSSRSAGRITIAASCLSPHATEIQLVLLLVTNSAASMRGGTQNQSATTIEPSYTCMTLFQSSPKAMRIDHEQELVPSIAVDRGQRVASCCSITNFRNSGWPVMLAGD